MKLLIVEDDPSIARPLLVGLEAEGFETEWVQCGEDALAAALPDAVLLDVRLPDLDGFAVCREIRSRSDVPIIMLTARGEEIDRVVGLELGADDYIVKPFGFRELVARIRAVTRRAGSRAAAGLELVAGALVIDTRTRSVRLDGAPLSLTPKEFDLLALLAADPGAVVTRHEILERVWGTTWFGPTKVIDVQIASLRRKLGNPAWIDTTRGVGFRLQVPE